MALDPISVILEIGSKVIDRLWPNPAERDAAKLKLLEMQQAGELARIASDVEIMKGQIEINKAEALSANLFVAGWRPFVGWTCGSGLAIQFVVGPLFFWISSLFGHPTAVPQLSMETLMTLLAGLLGLSGMRTFEKFNGVEGRHS